MKKTIKFFLVAIAATAMMFSACKKEDETNEEKNKSSELSAPELILPHNGSETGTSNFSFNWSPVKNGDNNATVDYVLSISQDNGKTWNDYFKGKLCQYTFEGELPKGIVYLAKVTATYTDSKGTKTLESKPFKFVSKYVNDIFGATILTPNAITFEWTDMLDYEYVELTKCKVSQTITGVFEYVDLQTIKVENKNSYTLGELTENERVGIKYKFYYDGKCVASGAYHTLAVDGTKYISDGEFKKIEIKYIPETNQTWIILNNFSDGNAVTCFANYLIDASDRIGNIAYKYHPATDSDWKVLEKYIGISEDDLNKSGRGVYRGSGAVSAKLLLDKSNETGLGLQNKAYTAIYEEGSIGCRIIKDNGIMRFTSMELIKDQYNLNNNKLILTFVKDEQ
jgi:hypothetical protein